MTTSREARTAREEAFHEIQLSGKQLVFLFMATTAVSVIIFLCGVLVGRGVRLAVGDETPAATAALVPEGAAPVAGTSAGPIASQVPGEGQAVAGETPEVPGSRYYEPLMAEQPPADTVVQVEPPPAELPEPTKVAPPTPAPSDGWVVQVTALRQRGEAQAIATRLVGSGYRAFVLDPQPGSTPLFRVRVGPFVERAEAEQAMERLVREEQFNPWISR